uniref:Retrovirus-related Pol polyprotein from transposon TNT 1-94-like beta-barrel domain-containing protein n=1 Tax=Cannabis sativa TaxID=3483 RepID=A0A803PNG3_CANSA
MSNNGNRPVCTHYGVPGHTAAKCYMVHGYPPSHLLHGRFPKEIPNKPENHQNRSLANFSAANNWPEGVPEDQDLISQCQKLMTMMAQRIQSQSQTSPSQPFGFPTQNDQCQNDHNQHPTVSNISNSVPSIPKTCWIIYTGATHHVCSDPSLFTSIQKNSRIDSVGMPNGVNAKVIFVGTIYLHGIVVHNVFYVPKFQFNLLSMCALSDSSNYSFLFLPTKCIVLYITKNQVIGMGERVVNLHYLHDQTVSSVSSIVNSEIILVMKPCGIIGLVMPLV